MTQEKYDDPPTFLWIGIRLLPHIKDHLRAVGRMKPDSFACFVVGDFRDGRGFYRNFVSETMNGFEQAGAKLYNENDGFSYASWNCCYAITKQFESGRKLAKTHQNVLVFVKVIGARHLQNAGVMNERTRQDCGDVPRSPGQDRPFRIPR